MTTEPTTASLIVDTEARTIIETTGVLDLVLRRAEIPPEHVARAAMVAMLLSDMNERAIRGGHAIQRNDGLVTMSEELFRQIAEDAERGRWRKVSEEAPPSMKLVLANTTHGKNLLMGHRLDPNTEWRPLD